MTLLQFNRCTIIINTYNRASSLRRLLSGLGHLKGEAFEVVVVDGPSTDNTEDVLNAYKDCLKIIQCSTRNLSESRNLGIAAAAGDIVVFIDDDALPGDANWLTRYVQAFSREPTEKTGALGGPAWHRDTTWAEFYRGATSVYGFQVFGNEYDNPTLRPKANWYVCTVGCNTAFRRAALIAIGGFDEFFVYYLDESDVCIRLARAGYKVDFLPENGVRHYKLEERSNPSNIRWDIIARSDTYFALKNARDRLPNRLFNTLTAAPRKHFFKEINHHYRNRNISFLNWCRLISKWASGVVVGCISGLFRPRHLGHFSVPAPPFLPFSPPTVENPLTIALLSQTLPGQLNYGGIGRYIYDLAWGLHENGHEIHIFTKDERPLRRESLGFTIHGISEADRVPLTEFANQPVLQKNLSYSMAVVNKMAELYAQGLEFEVIHAPNWDEEGIALIRSQVYPVVLVIATPMAQAILTEGWEANEDMRACVALDRWQILHADAVCSPSVGVWQSYQKLMGFTSDEMKDWQVVPQGIVPHHSASNLTKRSHFGLLFVGRFERRKGIHTLMAVLPKLMPMFPRWECHLIGDDRIPLPEGGTFKELFLAEQSGAAWLDRVIFHGIVSEEILRQEYQSCDLFVAPSLYESYGLIYHEAMQYGKAVVGCQTGGVPEVVRHGVEGLLIAPDCPEGLMEALITLMSDDPLRERMGQAGAERVHEQVNYRTMASGMEKIYRDVIKAGGGARRTTRTKLWPRELPLFAASDRFELNGPWEVREDKLGQRYLLGRPNASLSFQVRGGTSIRLVALRNSQSGVLAVRVNHSLFQFIDLFAPECSRLESPMVIDLPGLWDECIKVVLSVSEEHNLKSLASEVWLGSVAVINDVAPDHNGVASFPGRLDKD
jgi:glycogen synthase